MYLLVPRTLFPVPYSTLLYSSEGNLLGARIAPDGQWRFPATDSLPDKFITIPESIRQLSCVQSI